MGKNLLKLLKNNCSLSKRNSTAINNSIGVAIPIKIVRYSLILKGLIIRIASIKKIVYVIAWVWIKLARATKNPASKQFDKTLDFW